jgi:hypothetical protein
MDAFTVAAADMADSNPPHSRPFLVDDSTSELSLDESDMSYEKTPVNFYRSFFKEPAVKDFAYSQSNPASRKQSSASGHWVSWRPTRTLH